MDAIFTINIYELKKPFQQYLPGLILFVIAFIVGLYTYRDYGMAYDEQAQREIGTYNYNYIFKNDQSLLTFKDKDYGPGFEIPLTAGEHIFGITKTREVLFARHLVTHTFFLFAALSVYLLIVYSSGSQLLACLGFVMMLLCPRLYAHSFFNTKDIPFLSMITVSLFATYVAYRKSTITAYALLGVCCGYTTSLRIMGLMLPCILVFLLAIDGLACLAEKRSVKRVLYCAIAFFICYILFFIAFYPFLWRSPVSHLVNTWRAMSHFRWDGGAFINGQMFSTHKLPWYYFPLWFGITIPPAWLVSGVIAMAYFIIILSRKPLQITKSPERKFLFVCLYCFIVPVCAVIVLHAVLYDDWRHLFFVYPPFVIVTLFFLHSLTRPQLRYTAYIACLGQTAIVSFDMYRIHPYEQVYFNRFVSHKYEYLRHNYELDYWACSYKQALEWLAKAEKGRTIKVNSDQLWPLESNIQMLPDTTESRFKIVNKADADYFINNYRWHPDDYNYGTVIYRKLVFNSSIFEIAKANYR